MTKENQSADVAKRCATAQANSASLHVYCSAVLIRTAAGPSITPLRVFSGSPYSA
jgi:hypothetical protein